MVDETSDVFASDRANSGINLFAACGGFAAGFLGAAVLFLSSGRADDPSTVSAAGSDDSKPLAAQTPSGDHASSDVSPGEKLQNEVDTLRLELLRERLNNEVNALRRDLAGLNREKLQQVKRSTHQTQAPVETSTSTKTSTPDLPSTPVEPTAPVSPSIPPVNTERTDGNTVSAKKSLAYWNRINAVIDREAAMRSAPISGVTAAMAEEFLSRRVSAGEFASTALRGLDSSGVDREIVSLSNRIAEWYEESVRVAENGRLLLSADSKTRRGRSGNEYKSGEHALQQTVKSINRDGERVRGRMSKKYGLSFPKLK